MFFPINKKYLIAVFTATMLTNTAFYVLPASARLDEAVLEGEYRVPLAKAVEVVKAAGPKNVQVARSSNGNQIQMEYQVRSGDTLWSIAKRAGLSVDELAKANDLSEGDILAVGRTLVLPGREQRYHKVAAEETLSHIAGQYNISVQQLMTANNISDADFINVGRMLSIPSDEVQQELPVSANGQASKIQIGGWAWPVAGTITSLFGIRGASPHEGVDIGAVSGATINAPNKGKVVWAAPRGTYGNTVILDHDNGIRSLYAHCSKILVHEGQTINRNQPIALVGNTGRSSGPHLHMEILRQGIPLDPLLFLKEEL